MTTTDTSTPFLLLSTRATDEVAADEHETVARFLQVPREQVRQVRLEAGPMPDLEVTDYAGVVLGGSPFTSITPKKQRTDVQRRVEKDLQKLFRRLRAGRVAFLGLCYGVGTFGRGMGGTVDATFGEETSAVDLRVTAAGRQDRILVDVPDHFCGYVGHKEALSALPPEAVLLVTGTECPFQLWRLGVNQYVTQFHPEMDADALVRRMEAYKYAGYFSPEEFDEIAAQVREVDVSASHLVLRNFARLAREDHAAVRAGRELTAPAFGAGGTHVEHAPRAADGEVPGEEKKRKKDGKKHGKKDGKKKSASTKKAGKAGKAGKGDKLVKAVSGD